MVARGQAVSHAVMSGRRAMTKPRRKTPSIGPDVEGCEVHEGQIPGKKIEPQRPFLDTLTQRLVDGFIELLQFFFAIPLLLFLLLTCGVLFRLW